MPTLPSDTLLTPPDPAEELLHQLAREQRSRKKWLLIQPVSNTSMMVDSGTVSMPLNLIMVATMVGKLFDVTFIDERLGNKVPDDFSGFDVVAITSRTLNASRAYQIGDAALAQGRIVILGGVHPTMLHDEAAQHCTSVVYGEIESIWTELATGVLTGKMQRVYRAKELKPMGTMIHPDFNYALSSKNAKKYSSLIPLLATKGCPVGCNFCTTPTVYGKSYRYRELDLVLDEMRYHQERLGKKKINFSFMDDNISFRPKYFMTLLEEMAKLGVHWNANISMNFLDKPEVAELSGRSGCDLLSIGFESLNPETIKSVQKGSNRLGRLHGTPRRSQSAKSR